MKKILLITLLSSLSITSYAQVKYNFKANTKLESKCLISAQNISFGEYNPLSSNILYALGGLNVLCSKGVSYKIQPDGGYEHAAASGYSQMMKNTQNNDGLYIHLTTQSDNGEWLQWGRVGTNGNALPSGFSDMGSIGVGENKHHAIRISLLNSRKVKEVFPSATNTHNYNASPGIYTLNMTATIIY